MAITKELGAWGENLAKKYLLAKGYEFIAANHRVGRLELDLIYKKNNWLVFIEVKTRRETPASSLDNQISAAQLRRLKRALAIYASKNRVNLDAVRLDLIIILVNRRQKRAKLKHYQDIF